MINFINKFFTQQELPKCECCGFEIEEGKLPVKRTYNRFQVCPNAAIKSSLEQMGSGIRLSPELADELRKTLEKYKD